MFGSKKNKNDFEDDFAFDDDGSDIGQPQSLMKGGGGSNFSPKILIVVLLLILAGGGAYYFLNQSKPKTPPARPASARKTVAVAPKPAAPAQKPAAPTAQTVPAAVPAQPQSTTGPAAVKPVPSVHQPAAPAVKTAASSPVPPPPTEQAAPPPSAPVAESPVQSGGGAYVLRGGAYVTKESLLEAERKVRRLGFKPKVTVVRRTVPMTRLRIGYYSPREAQQKLKELAAFVPDAFTLRHGDQVALYAGSYTIIDKARSFADELYQKGIRVEEEPAEILMPVKQLSYGAFATRAAAEKASRKARSIGLPADVEKRP